MRCKADYKDRYSSSAEAHIAFGCYTYTSVSQAIAQFEERIVQKGHPNSASKQKLPFSPEEACSFLHPQEVHSSRLPSIASTSLQPARGMPHSLSPGV